MKKLFLTSALILFCSILQAQKRPLNDSVYDTWKTIESFTISDDGVWSFTQYKYDKKSFALDIKIRDISFRKYIDSGTSPKFFNNQKSAIFKVKDTLFTIQKSSGEIRNLGASKIFDADERSHHFSYMKGKTLYIRNIENDKCDSIPFVVKSSFISQNLLALILRNEKETSLVTVNLNNPEKFDTSTIYRSNSYISDFSSDNKGKRIIFFTSPDSVAVTGVETIVADLDNKTFKTLALNEKMLPSGMYFNLKKGISFSSNDKFLKFEITSVKQGKTVDKKMGKHLYEYELWRWNDTLLPIQKRSKVFQENIRCIYYPESNKFIQLSLGLGVFLHADDNSLFGFEFVDDPYLYNSTWEDPTPKDIHCVNIENGAKKLLFKEFKGTFSISQISPQFFTYEYADDSWYVTDIDRDKKIKLSSKMPYPAKVQDFDKPQPAGSYGQANLSSDGKYFIVYDKYDVWALPITGEGKPICLTKEFGRRNNIRFKIVKMEEKGEKPNGVDLKSTILLESVNYNNMNSGFYRLEKGKEPVKLIEGEYKYSFVRKLGKDKYIVKRESFNEAPDLWLTDKDLQLKERLTDLNDQKKGYSFGKSKVIKWKDNLGKEQSGVLYTPEGYDSTKKYPVIVYFYETMTQDAFLFYPPAPTTSTINPVMFVSRGYVVFMPDIRYEIGWPGKSCVNIVVSGTKHLIDSGIADPKRVGVEGHSWGGYQVAFLITQTDLFTCACSEAAVANMTSAYTGIRKGAGTPRMFMYESSQSRIGGNLWEKQENYIKNSPVFFLNNVKTPLLSRHSDDDEAVPYSQGVELFLGLKRLNKQVWMFNYKGDGHNIRKREIAKDWSRRMDEYFDFYLMDGKKPDWMK